MKKKMFKTIFSLSLMLLIISILCIGAFAYQADAVHAYGYFPDSSINCHGYLYVISVGSWSNPALGTAETEVSVRTSNITEIYVRYWFNENNTSMITPIECYAPSGYRITPSFYNQDEGVHANSLEGYHRVVYTVDDDQTLTWTGTTIEYDEFGG